MSILGNTKRFPVLSWLIIPILGVWIATNYLVGIFAHPQWSNQNLLSETSANSGQVTQTEVVPAYSWSGGALVTFWFDDGWLTQYLTAFPILQDKKYPAALAIPTKAVGWDAYMSWAQIRKLRYYGWEITSHSRSHQCDLNKIVSMDNEVIGSKEDLKEEGYLTDIYVTPCGSSNPTLMESVKKNYLYLRTSDDGLNPLPVKDPYNLLIHEVQNPTSLADVSGWIDEAKINKGWLILMFHKVDDSGELYSVTPKTLKTVVDMVAQSNLPVVTPSQALNLTR